LPARNEFLRIAQLWVDDEVPWRKVGSTREGANCIGYPIGVAREMGGYNELVALGTPLAMLPRPLTPRMMVDAMQEHMVPIMVQDAIPGDMLLFRLNGRPDHIALIASLKPLQFFHADRDARRMMKTSLPAGWIPTMAFRIEDLDR
jgi:hypothetical protein